MKHPRTVTRRLLLFLGVASTLTAIPGVASAKQAAATRADVRATYTYLVARRRFAESFDATAIAAGEQAVHALAIQVAAGCPGVLATASESASDPIRFEAFTDVGLTLELPERNATISFAKAVEPLHWSNRNLTYYVHGFAAEARANAEIPISNLCADAEALAATGFQTVPAATTRLLRESEDANDKTLISEQRSEHLPGELPQKILQMLKPYERRSERLLIPPTRSKHQRTQEEEQAVKTYFTPGIEILHLLGIHTEEPPAATPPAG